MDNETTPNPESDELRISQGGWRKELIEESKTLEIDNNFENLYPLVNFLTEDLTGYQILEDEELIPLKPYLQEHWKMQSFTGISNFQVNYVSRTQNCFLKPLNRNLAWNLIKTDVL